MEYPDLAKSSYTVDVMNNNRSFVMGDSKGRLIVENLIYSKPEPI
jgi:hypothetical protein